MRYTSVLSMVAFATAGILLVPAALGLVDVWFYTIYGITVSGIDWTVTRILGTGFMTILATVVAGVGSMIYI